MNTHVPAHSILLATNLSDINWLFPLACFVAEESGAKITLLHVLPAIHGFTIDLGCEPYYDPREAIAAAEKELKAICGRPCAAKIQTEIVVIDGSPSDGILATARQVHADMVIMGTAGHRGMDKWLLGSVAETVLRSACMPVITVGPHARRAAASGRPIQSILFAASLSCKSPKAVQIAYQWAERLNGHMTLMHVGADDRKDKQTQEPKCMAREKELRAMLPEEAFEKGVVDTQVRTGRACQEILTAAANADLIVMGAEHPPLLGRLAPEGTLYSILAEAHCPVATFHHDHVKANPI